MEPSKEVKTREGARAVILDEEGRVAILEVNGGEYFKIPGGGVEAGESFEDAARREALEEAGCEIEIIAKVGEREFDNLNHHHSVCYLARKVGKAKAPNFTAEEKDFKLLWLLPEEALKLFEEAGPQTEFNSQKNDRDKSFLREAIKRID